MGHVGERAEGLGTVYGQVSKATVATIQRRLLTLEQDGGARIFGEPALALDDLMLTAPDGRGAVNVLVADTLISARAGGASGPAAALANPTRGRRYIGAASDR